MQSKHLCGAKIQVTEIRKGITLAMRHFLHFKREILILVKSQQQTSQPKNDWQ
jgi:hypothetical protein